MTAAAVGGLALVVVLLTVLVAGLLRSHAEIIRALHDLGISLDPEVDRAHAEAVAAGTATERAVRRAAPVRSTGPVDITGTDLDGGAVRVAVTGVPRRTLLAFLSSSCLTCRAFWTALREPEVPVPGDARLVIVVRDRDAESPAALLDLAAPHVPTIHSSEGWDAYQVPGAPYFVLVDGERDAIVGEGTATSWEHVRNLLGQALADASLVGGAAREAKVDGALRAAGIEPGDPSLYAGGEPPA